MERRIARFHSGLIDDDDQDRRRTYTGDVIFILTLFALDLPDFAIRLRVPLNKSRLHTDIDLGKVGVKLPQANTEPRRALSAMSAHASVVTIANMNTLTEELDAVSDELGGREYELVTPPARTGISTTGRRREGEDPLRRPRSFRAVEDGVSAAPLRRCVPFEGVAKLVDMEFEPRAGGACFDKDSAALDRVIGRF